MTTTANVDPMATLVAELQDGHSIQLTAGGGSMRGRIEVGQVMTISPIDVRDVQVGDVVLTRWKKGRYLTHLIREIDGDRVLIGNNLGKINGWVAASDILGKVTQIDDPQPAAR